MVDGNFSRPRPPPPTPHPTDGRTPSAKSVRSVEYVEGERVEREKSFHALSKSQLHAAKTIRKSSATFTSKGAVAAVDVNTPVGLIISQHRNSFIEKLL